MKDQSEPQDVLASIQPLPKTNPARGDVMEAKEKMLLNLLEELVRSWSNNFTPAEVRQDLEKIRVLNKARSSISEGAPSELVKQFYREVFLRDVWSGNGA